MSFAKAKRFSYSANVNTQFELRKTPSTPKINTTVTKSVQTTPRSICSAQASTPSAPKNTPTKESTPNNTGAIPKIILKNKEPSASSTPKLRKRRNESTVRFSSNSVIDMSVDYCKSEKTLAYSNSFMYNESDDDLQSKPKNDISNKEQYEEVKLILEGLLGNGNKFDGSKSNITEEYHHEDDSSFINNILKHVAKKNSRRCNEFLKDISSNNIKVVNEIKERYEFKFEKLKKNFNEKKSESDKKYERVIRKLKDELEEVKKQIRINEKSNNQPNMGYYIKNQKSSSMVLVKRKQGNSTMEWE